MSVRRFLLSRSQSRRLAGRRASAARGMSTPGDCEAEFERELNSVSTGQLERTVAALKRTEADSPSPARKKTLLASGAPGSADQRISGGWRTHGGAEARREQREESTTGAPGPRRAIGVSRALACLLCWNARGCPQAFQHVPRSSILSSCAGA
jgi:hypothetical protein